MKYSILMPYYKRSTHLYNTLISFLHHYKSRSDYEVILIEDYKNVSDKKEHNMLLGIIDNLSKQVNIKHIKTDFKNCYAPVKLFNAGAESACGKYLVLTNPECFHLVDILGGFDKELSKNPNAYVIASCFNVSYNGIIDRFEDFKYKQIIWYQHSKHNNRMLHFCSVISKKLYDDIGGFDEGYAKGFQWDDNDFIRTIKNSGIKVVTKDDLIVAHMEHGYNHLPDKANLCKINRKYYSNKWRRKTKG